MFVQPGCKTFIHYEMYSYWFDFPAIEKAGSWWIWWVQKNLPLKILQKGFYSLSYVRPGVVIAKDDFARLLGFSCWITSFEQYNRAQQNLC